MNSPLIGITTYGQNETEHFVLPRQYVDCVRRSGGIPLLTPPGEVQCRTLLSRIDGLVLTGGGDINPACYVGELHETIYKFDDERDAGEIELARSALAARLPTLAICRGLQIVNVALGGTLIENIPDEFGNDVEHRLPPHEPTEHWVSIDPESRLSHLMGRTEVVTVSWHHQAVRTPADGLTSIARAPDGIVEALETAVHPNLIAVQWHPELTAHRDPSQQSLFDAFIKFATD